MMRFELFLSFLLSIFLGSTEAQIPKKERWADQLTAQEQYVSANTIYDSLRHHFLNVGQDSSYVRVLIKLTKNYQEEGGYDQALQEIEAADSSAVTQPEEKIRLAEAHHQMGVNAYQDADLYATAIQHWKAVLRLRDSIIPKNDISLVKAKRNMAYAYSELRDFRTAKTFLEDAIRLYESRDAPDPFFLITPYSRLGGILSELEDLEKAKQYLDQSLGLARKQVSKEPWTVAEVHESMWFFFKSQSDYDSMFYHVRQSIKLLDPEYKDDVMPWANAHHNLGTTYYLNDQPDQALHYLNLPLTTYRDSNKLDMVALSYNMISLAHRKKEAYDEALSYNQKAFGLYQKLEDWQGQSDCFNNRGDILLDQERYDEALQAHQASIILLVPEFEATDPSFNPGTASEGIGSRPDLISSLGDKARVLLAMSHSRDQEKYLRLALMTFDTMAQFIDKVRIGFSSDDSKAFLAKKAKAVFRSAIQAAMALYRKDENGAQLKERMLSYSSRSKGLILLEAIRRAHARSSSNIPSSFLVREQQLQRAISEAEENLFEIATENGLSSGTAIEWRSRLLESRRQLDLLIDSLENFSAYYQAKAQSPVYKLANIQEQLSADQGILEYFLEGGQLFIFYIDRDGVEVIEQQVDSTLNWQVNAFRENIYRPYTDTSAQGTPFNTQLGYQLYQKLIQPIAQRTDLKRKLTIIPDGILGQLPFDALLTAPVSTTTPSESIYNYPFLGKKKLLSYNYSLTLWAKMQEPNNQLASDQILAFAPAFTASGPVRFKRAEVNFQNLLLNQSDTREIMSWFKGEMFMDSEATKEKFIDLASQYGFLHLFTHAQMNDRYPDYSFISFAQTEDRIQEDQLLYTYELYNYRLPLEMVILSACETTLGSYQEGEGIISLARAFSYAGTRSLVTSLWQVSEQKAGQLMKVFYQELRAGKPKDEALWAAKQELIRSEGAPYYWAGFIPIGNMEAVVIAEPWPWYYYVGILVPPLLAVLFFRRRRKENTKN